MLTFNTLNKLPYPGNRLFYLPLFHHLQSNHLPSCEFSVSFQRPFSLFPFPNQCAWSFQNHNDIHREFWHTLHQWIQIQKKQFHQDVMQNVHHKLWLNNNKQMSKGEWKIDCVICGNVNISLMINNQVYKMVYFVKQMKILCKCITLNWAVSLILTEKFSTLSVLLNLYPLKFSVITNSWKSWKPYLIFHNLSINLYVISSAQTYVYEDLNIYT